MTETRTRSKVTRLDISQRLAGRSGVNGEPFEPLTPPKPIEPQPLPPKPSPPPEPPEEEPNDTLLDTLRVYQEVLALASRQHWRLPSRHRRPEVSRATEWYRLGVYLAGCSSTFLAELQETTADVIDLVSGQVSDGSTAESMTPRTTARPHAGGPSARTRRRSGRPALTVVPPARGDR